MNFADIYKKVKRNRKKANKKYTPRFPKGKKILYETINHQVDDLG
jgi:hypothetical protein